MPMKALIYGFDDLGGGSLPLAVAALSVERRDGPVIENGPDRTATVPSTRTPELSADLIRRTTYLSASLPFRTILITIGSTTNEVKGSSQSILTDVPSTMRSHMLTFDLGELTTKLIALPVKHRIVFVASCCERLLPNYRAFSLMENWGDVHILERSLDVVWQFLSGVEVKTGQIHKLKEQCEKVTPDTEDFSSLFTSAALDAASAVCETLTCCLNADAERVAGVGSLARDTIDMFIQVHDELDYSDQDFEAKILRHPLMIEELEKQRQDIESLSSVSELSPDFLERFRQSAKTAGLQPFSRGFVIGNPSISDYHQRST
jgi:uncharacterized protein